MSKAGDKWMAACASMGCIACYIDCMPGTPAEMHHVREGVGKSQRADDTETIPLCPAHHRGQQHRPGRPGHVPSIHADKRAFIARYGTERELLEKTRLIVGT